MRSGSQSLDIYPHYSGIIMTYIHYRFSYHFNTSHRYSNLSSSRALQVVQPRYFEICEKDQPQFTQLHVAQPENYM